MLLELNIDIKTRGEKLSLEQFAQISDYIEERKKQKKMHLPMLNKNEHLKV